MTDTEVCRRFIVSGRVQGVYFRASTARQARRLHLRGSAINLPDGRVQVVACGTQQAVDALALWLGKGPPLARVDRVESEATAQPQGDGFGTG